MENINYKLYEIEEQLKHIKNSDNHSMNDERIDKLLKIALYALCDVTNEMGSCNKSFFASELLKLDKDRI